MKRTLWDLAVGSFIFILALTCASKPVSAGELRPDEFGTLLTLDEAVGKTLRNDSQIKQAAEKLEKEKALYQGAKAEFFPKLSTNVLGAFATGDKHFINYFDAGLEQPIFEGGKNRARRHAEEAAVQAETLKLAQAKLDVECELKLIYAGALEEKELTRTSQEAVKELQDAYERIKQLTETGVLTKRQLFRAESLLEKTRHGLIKHKENYDYFYSVLKNVTGTGQNESIELERIENFPELKPDVSLYLENARRNDPIYQLKDFRVRQKQFEKRELEAGRLPHVSLAAKWDRISDVFTDTNRAVLGLQGTWNIWDFGRTSSEIKAKSHEIEETRWEGETLIRKHEDGILKLFHDARTARQKIRMLDALLQERSELYKNEKSREIAGEKGSIELLDSYQALEEARVQNLEAVIEYRALLIKLARKSGLETLNQAIGGESVQ